MDHTEQHTLSDASPEMERPETASPETGPVLKSLARCYILLGGFLLASFAPIGPVALPFMIGVVACVVWAYRLRRRDHAMARSHGTWMIRSFWISSILFLLAIVLAGGVISSHADNSAIDNLAAQGKGIDEISQEALQNAGTIFYDMNASLIFWATIIPLILPVGYAALRYVHGFRRLRAGQEIENVKSLWI